jgi:hypothetical protein
MVHQRRLSLVKQTDTASEQNTVQHRVFQELSEDTTNEPVLRSSKIVVLAWTVDRISLISERQGVVPTTVIREPTPLVCTTG